jgi:uncharacterized protein (TIGR02598 family)
VKRNLRATRAFSLVEVAVALGIAGFCLISVFALLPIGVQTNYNAISQSASASIIAAVSADMRATPKTSATSVQFGITFGAAKTLYFDSEGTASSSILTASRFKVNVTFPPNPSGPGGATFAHLKVTWPAAASSANAVGSTEAFAAFDRH